MQMRNLKLDDVFKALTEEGYFVDEPHTDEDGDQVIDVYADENSQRILEMTFDRVNSCCVAYCFIQTGFTDNYVGHITATLEALNA